MIAKDMHGGEIREFKNRKVMAEATHNPFYETPKQYCHGCTFSGNIKDCVDSLNALGECSPARRDDGIKHIYVEVQDER